MNNTDQSAHPERSGDASPRLSKDEMRQKIKASLAAGTAPGVNAAYPTEQPGASKGPVQKPEATSQSASRPAMVHTKRPAPEQPHNNEPSESLSREEKARRIRETMSANRKQEEPNTPPKQQRRPAAAQQQASQNRKQPAPAQPARRRPAEDYKLVSDTKSRSYSQILMIVGIVILGLLLAFYIGGLAVYHGKFLPSTYVNDICISGMTGEDAQKAILDAAQEESITFIQKDGKEIVFQGSSFGCISTLPKGSLDDAAAESHALWFTKLFTKSEFQVTPQESYSEADLASLIAAYDWGNVAPTDAEIVQNEDGSFSIQPEDDGNMVDAQKLSNYAISEMRMGHNVISMVESDCYKTAKVRSEDLEDTLALYQKIGSMEVTFDMTDRQDNIDPAGTETVDNETLLEWIDTDGKKITLDKDAATEWVQENIADKYDTLVTGYTRTFESTLDGTIELPIGTDGIYGWKTDVEATVDKLEKEIQDGESLDLEPVYKVEGFRKGDDKGNTYIEVDICQQKLFYYVDGELFLETDVVTGTATDPSRATPPGAFKVWSKESPRKLGTYAVQGYEVWVTYWMPVTYTGIGLHDLNRSAYGGSIYQTNGSHGCINLPLDIAGQIYDEVEIGTPVMIIP